MKMTTIISKNEYKRIGDKKYKNNNYDSEKAKKDHKEKLKENKKLTKND